jgi:hypothetical protein
MKPKSMSTTKTKSTTAKAATKSKVGTTSRAMKSPVAQESNFVGRLGTFFLNINGKLLEEPGEEIYQAVLAAVKKDNRVVSTRDASFDSAFSEKRQRYPFLGEKKDDDLINGSDYFINMMFWHPFAFEVLVPKKNQPIINGNDDVPTDHYWAAWDGVTLVVIWKGDKSKRYPPISGGHVVEEILRAATQSIGADLVVQPCDLGCSSMFVHRCLLINQRAGTGRLDFRITQHEKWATVAHFDLDFTGSPIEVAEQIHSNVGFSSDCFASFKNLSRRLFDLEEVSMSLTNELLDLDSQALNRSKGKLLTRSLKIVGNSFKTAWTGVGGRRTSNRIISSLWISMLRIETVKHQTESALRGFHDIATLMKCIDLFDRDMTAYDIRLREVDTQFVRASIEQKSSRMDNMGVVWATLGGAVLGAVLVAVGGILFN